MKPIALLAGLVVSATALPVLAEQQEPVNLNGTWNMEYSITIRSPSGRPAKGVPICDLAQSGNSLAGTCKIIDAGGGPIRGSVDGRHIQFQWNFSFCPPVGGSLPEYGSRYAVTRFKGELGSDGVLHGHYQSYLEPGWNRVFFASSAAADDRVPCYFPARKWPTFKPALKDANPWGGDVIITDRPPPNG
jgi:hypothetical protein